MSAAKTDFLLKAKAAWGGDLPEWVDALVSEANRTTAAQAAKRIGYSGAVVSYVISNSYTGDISRVEAKVRGALMNVTVMCPVFGEMALDFCLSEQKKGNTFTSAARGQIYRNCRGIGVPKCPNSRIPDGQR